MSQSNSCEDFYLLPTPGRTGSHFITSVFQSKGGCVIHHPSQKGWVSKLHNAYYLNSPTIVHTHSIHLINEIVNELPIKFKLILNLRKNLFDQTLSYCTAFKTNQFNFYFNPVSRIDIQLNEILLYYDTVRLFDTNKLLERQWAEVIELKYEELTEEYILGKLSMNGDLFKLKNGPPTHKSNYDYKSIVNNYDELKEQFYASIN